MLDYKDAWSDPEGLLCLLSLEMPVFDSHFPIISPPPMPFSKPPKQDFEAGAHGKA